MPLFHVQDTDGDSWVIAYDYGQAVQNYRNAIAKQDESDPADVDHPEGVTLICRDCDILIGDADVFLDEAPDWERNIGKVFDKVAELLAIPDPLCPDGVPNIEVRETLLDMVLVRVSKWDDLQLRAVEEYIDELGGDPRPAADCYRELQKFVGAAIQDLTKGPQ